MAQNATPNISDEHVSCTAPATRHASLQISSNVSLLPSFSKMPQNPHFLLTFGKVQNPSRMPPKTTSEPSKAVRPCDVFNLLYPFNAYNWTLERGKPEKSPNPNCFHPGSPRFEPGWYFLRFCGVSRISWENGWGFPGRTWADLGRPGRGQPEQTTHNWIKHHSNE